MKFGKTTSVLLALSLAAVFSACSSVTADKALSTPLTEAFVNEAAPFGEAEVGVSPVGDEAKSGDIIILYTNDVHCGINDGIGYGGLSAVKKAMLERTDYVSLVDVGDHLQGDTIGAVSKGAYIIQIMNKAGYDFAVLGNHEFDYGLSVLHSNMMAAEFQYLDCNVEYTGTGNDPFFGMKPYEIAEYGDRKVAFIGVTTPETTVSTNPQNLRENQEKAVSFSADSASEFYERVQQSIDECKAAGADYIILLAHLGTAPVRDEFGSTALIANTEGVDVILDAHSHSFICSDYLTDKNGDRVIRSSTGTKLQSVGELLITAEGNITTSLITSFPEKDQEVQSFIDSIEEAYKAETEIKIGSTGFDLRIADDKGIRKVRNRETNLADLCADAYREILGAQIGWVNGGTVRDSIPAGEITYGDILRAVPFGTEISLISAKGQHILDALEMASMKTEGEYKNSEGASSGESGAFAQVSGMKYTIDTSVRSAVVLDGSGNFVEVSGNRRVSSVFVEGPEGVWEELDPEKYYTVAVSKFISQDGGDGMNMFLNDEVILDACDVDYNVIMKYITENLKGVIPGKYAKSSERITVK